MYGRSLKLFSMITVVVAVLAVSLSAQMCETENWDSQFFRPGQISANKVAAAGGKIYVAGTFPQTYDLGGGNRSTRQVAGIMTWDGTKWNFPSWEQGLNAGGGSWTFTAIMPFGNEVIVAGDFTQTNGGDMTIKYIARWDGMQFWPLGDGVNARVSALATTGNFDVYAGGQFTRIGADTAHYVAKWTSGGGWTPLFDPSETQQGTNGPVTALAIYNNRIVLSGAFTNVASGIPANHLAEWNWTTNGWDQFAGGADEAAERLAVGVGGLYASGVDTVGTVPITGVAHWDGAQWHDLATPSFAGIADIDVWSGDLIACGSYLDNPPDQANRTFARYNALTSQWVDFLPSCNLEAPGNDIAVDGINIYSVIAFGFGSTYVCGSSTGSLVHFDGNEWRGLGEGMTENGAWGTALSVTDTAVYVGGILGWLGGVGRHNGAGQWSFADDRWHSFTMDGTIGLQYSGFDATIWDIEEINGDVYLTGQFTNAGTITAGSIVGWDGNAFFGLGGGVTNPSIVYAVEPFQNDIYFAGTIYSVIQPNMSQQSLGGFIRWNGAMYERPDSISAGTLFELENGGDYLYLGGQWTAGFQSPTASIMKYDGNAPDSVGGGLTGRVYDIEISGADVYVSGGFSTAYNADGSPISVHNLARWNGVTWEELGNFNDTVRAIYIRGGEIYAGGHFTMVDGVPASHIAWYNGTQWKALGEGTEGEYIYTNGVVYELDSDGDALWVVGRFAFANTLPSQNIARWAFCTPAPPPVAQGGGAVVNGTSVTLNWGGSSLSAAATTYDLQVSSGADFSNLLLDSTGITATSLVLSGLLENTEYSWRVRAVVDAETGAWSARNSFSTGTASGCCAGARGNANGDPEDKLNVTDIVYLVQYLFGVPSGPAPVCTEEANTNGDPEEKINVTDITFLVQHLFGVPNGPAPPNCP